MINDKAGQNDADFYLISQLHLLHTKNISMVRTGGSDEH